MPERGNRALGSRYELTDLLGRGGMGEVWKAWDREKQRVVAAKLLHRQFTQDPEIVARFVQERSILIGLRHPNIVQVLDLVVEGDNLAIVMEYVGGGSLGQYRRRVQTMSEQEAVSVVCGVLEAMALAHSKGVIHRDIKPDNVLLTSPDDPSEATVRLGDFGIARLAQSESVRATGLLGTPAYMPPELFESGVFSQASDVYAIGTMLYELIAGRTPFEGGTSPMAVGIRHVYSLPPRIPVSQDLWNVMETMLAKNPAHRLTAKDTCAALRAIPADRLSEAPLPAQTQPDTWEDVTEYNRLGGTLHIQAIEGDVGQTVVPVPGPVTGQTPVEGTVKAVIEVGTGDFSSATMLASARNRGSGLILEPQIPLPAKKKRSPWVIPGSVAAGVVVLAVLVIFIPRLFAAPVSAIAYQPGYAIGAQLPSGLRLDYEATAGPDPGTVSLAVTSTAARESGLTGDILVVFPQDDGKCPVFDPSQVDAPVSPILQSLDGLDAPCGYRLSLHLGAGEAQTAHFTVSGVLQADLGQWISAVQSTTSQVLAAVVGTDFAIQRVTGIQVSASDVRLASNTVSVPYQVFAVWANQEEPSAADILFSDTTLDYQTTDLFMSLTGGGGFSRVAVSSCSSAEVIGHRVVAEQPSESCQIGIRVGALDPADDTFSIRMLPS